MRRALFILCAAMPALLFVSGARPSDKSRMREFPWGTLERLPAGPFNMKLRIHPRPPESSSPALLTQRAFWYAISPSEELSVEVLTFTAAAHKYPNLYRSVPQESGGRPAVADGKLEKVKLTELSQIPRVSVRGYGWFRGFYVARIEITPYYAGAGGSAALFVDELTVGITRRQIRSVAGTPAVLEGDRQFDSVLHELIVNYDEAPPYRMPTGEDSTGGWFNTFSTYVKLGVGSDGIYRFTQPQLADLVPSVSGVDPRTIQVFDRGNELPVFVSGESDGTFDAGDYVEFPALRTYTGKQRVITHSLAEEYNEYLDRYTDTTILWMTWGTTSGKRAGTNPAVTTTAETLKTYTAFEHLESQGIFPGLQSSNTDLYSQQDYRWNPHDFWPWNFLGANASASASFSAADIVQGGDSVTIYAKFASWGTNVVTAAHTIGIRLNGGPDLSTATLNRGDQIVLSGKTAASALAGGTNSVSLFSYPTASNPNYIIYDWFEVEYPRQLVVANDSLLFDFRSLSERKLRNIRITGLRSSSVLLYRKSPSPERIANYSISAGAPYTLVFADTAGPNERYVLLSPAKVKSPVVERVKSFAGLRTNKGQTDYIAVTHPKFLTEAEQYVQSVGTAKQLTTRLVNVDDIFDEFAFGYPTPEAIRRFVRSAFQWNAPSPSYLVLLGDASYDYKFYDGYTTAINYVPSYGYPVSDVAYAVLDTVTNVPQLYVGRIPLNNAGELSQYLAMSAAYASTPYDDWNKRFLFFSGGDPKNGGQMALLKTAHDEIVTTMAKPAPVGGIVSHFYKTVSPQSDFGPYTSQEIEDAISAGGVFISYIGHSGTQTWDNSIGDPLQLKNSRGRFSLITDFGCSTAKFAEPLLTSFSEAFVIGPAASAIAYIGNSSLGFENIAVTLPQKFYFALLRDSLTRLGKTHLTAKLRKVAQEGYTVENGIMMYNNTLVGDPTVDIKIPRAPNLVAQQNLTSLPVSGLTDDKDSVGMKLVYANYGSVTRDSVDILVRQTYLSSVVRSTSFCRTMPLTFDTLTFYATVRSRPGEHSISMTLDPQNTISELNETDNAAAVSFLVSSTDFKLVSPPPMSVSSVPNIVLLNPASEQYEAGKVVSLELDTTGSFAAPYRLSSPMGVVSSSFSAASLPRPARYAWRARIQGGTAGWTNGSMYVGNLPNTSLGAIDSVAKSSGVFSDVELAGADIALQKRTNTVRAISSGTYDGRFGVIEVNGLNKIPDSFAGGHNILVLDTLTLDVVKFGNFDMYEFPAEHREDSLVGFIDSTPVGMIVASVVIHEGSVGLTSVGRAAYKTIGASSLIDSLGFRDSYAIVGRKGSTGGSVLESFKRSTTGKAIVETTFVRKAAKGSYVTAEIGPVSAWNDLQIDKSEPSTSFVKTTFIGVEKTGTADTLIAQTSSRLVSLSSIDPSRYPSGTLTFDFGAGNSLESPTLRNWIIRAQTPSELAVSQNTVTLQKAVMQEGEVISLSGRVYNVGASKAESVAVSLSTNDSGPLRTLSSAVVPLLNPGDSAVLTAQYDSRGRRGIHSFVFAVNAAVNELYKSNNSVAMPYTVTADTVRPEMEVTFDNRRVQDGDFVRSTPLVLFQLRDVNGTGVSQADTSKVRLVLDGKQVFYTAGSDIQFMPGTPPVLAEIRWAPQLSEGDHTVRYFATDVAGNSTDTTSLYVRVSSRLEISDVYNIPNPFGAGTTFTFTLAGAEDPQSVHIKIYTVAGRLIQDLDITPRVHIGANGYNGQNDNLYWNGRDKDGNEIANGIYLYRVIVSGSGQQTTATQKLVKMR